MSETGQKVVRHESGEWTGAWTPVVHERVHKQVDVLVAQVQATVNYDDAQALEQAAATLKGVTDLLMSLPLFPIGAVVRLDRMQRELAATAQEARARMEAAEISPEDLMAAAAVYDTLTTDGLDAFYRREEDAMQQMRRRKTD